MTTTRTQQEGGDNGNAATKPLTGMVTAHIYDVGTRKTIQGFNFIADTLFNSGAYHAGIEVYGREWTFQLTATGGTGLFYCEPKKNPSHSYKKSIELGVTPLDEDHVWLVLRDLKDVWLGADYDLIRKNCCHFCNAFCERLEVELLPDKYLKLARKAKKYEDRARSIRQSANNIRERAHERAHRVKERLSHNGPVHFDNPHSKAKRNRSASEPHSETWVGRDPVIEIWRSISPKPDNFQLINLERTLKKEGMLRVLCESGSTQEVHAYLFNDVLLICVALEKGKLHLRYLMEFRGRIGIKIEDAKGGFSSELQIPSEVEAGVEFRIITPKKTLVLCAKTKEEKDSWVSELRELVYGLAQKVLMQETRGLLGGTLTVRANASMKPSREKEKHDTTIELI